MRAPLGLVLLLTGSPPLPAPTPAPVLMHATRLSGVTRLTFDLPASVQTVTRHHGTAATIRFSGAAPLTAAPGTSATLPGLAGYHLDPGLLSLTLVPGVTLRSTSLAGHRVVDLIDPPAGFASPGPLPPATANAAVWSLPPVRIAAAPAAFADLPSVPAVLVPASSAAAPAIAATAAAVAATTPPVMMPPAPSLPPRPPIAPSPAPGSSPPAQALSITLPFPAGTGAAMFRRGGYTLIVFDEQRAIDPAALRALPDLADAHVQLLSNAVLIRLPASVAPHLAATGNAWTLSPALSAPSACAIAAIRGSGSLRLTGLPTPRIVTVPDPATGGAILVATSASAGPCVATSRRFAGFALLPTLLGAAIDPLSDRIALQAVADGVVVTAAVPGEQLPLAAVDQHPVAASASRLTRTLDLPDEPVPALLRRMQAAQQDDASAPPLARLAPRVRLAQSLLALGLGPEAQAVLALAAADDPRALTDPATTDLAAMAALEGGRLAEAGALKAVPTPEPDEHRVWRALLAVASLPSASAPAPAVLADLAATSPLLTLYPASLARTLIPIAAQGLLAGGALDAADALLAGQPATPALELARAASSQAHGEIPTALASYDHLAQGRDRSVRARAAIAAITLRAATGQLSAAAAAAAGETLFYAWRGDGRERDLMFQVAAWHGRAGQYRQQLQTLRDALALFPDPADGVSARLQDAFAGLLGEDAPAGGVDHLSPIDLVALTRENADLLPTGPAGIPLALRVADRLAALDLPDQAADALASVLLATTDPVQRATIGARLAALRLQLSAPAPALDLLARTTPPAGTVLPAGLAANRLLLAAQAQSQHGDLDGAGATLASATDQPARLARASLAEQTGHWGQAASDLSSYAAAVLPASGLLDATQSAIVLRLAGALAQANDEAGLARLRAGFAARLAGHDDAALLDLLTAPPVKARSDLTRAGLEQAAAHQLPTLLSRDRASPARLPPG